MDNQIKIGRCNVYKHTQGVIRLESELESSPILFALTRAFQTNVNASSPLNNVIKSIALNAARILLSLPGNIFAPALLGNTKDSII